MKAADTAVVGHRSAAHERRHGQQTVQRATAFALAAGVLLGTAACRSDASSSAGVLTDTLPGGMVRVRNLAPETDSLQAAELLRIGEVDGSDAYVFGRIAGVAIGGDGTIYVLDNQSRQLRIFNQSGAHVRTVGGSGAGPSEFRDPRGIAWHPEGTLWVMDYANQRYSVVSAAGDVVATYPRRVPARGTRWEGGFDASGALYDSGMVRDSSGTRPVYIRHEVRAGILEQTDTFPLPATRSQDFAVTFPGGILSIPVPFSPRLSWAFDGRGAIWIGEGVSYGVVMRRLAGDTLLVVELDRSAAPVSSAERDAARTEIEALLQRAGGNAGDIDFSLIPSHKPAHGRLFVDDRARLWVARVPDREAGEGPAETVFDVFSDAGRHLGHVTLGVLANLPLAVRDGLAAGISRDELGTEQVVVYRLAF